MTRVNKKLGKTTQREVAQLAGVGRSTVSMALRGDKRISPEIRARVIEASKQLNYSITNSNDEARRLIAKRLGRYVPFKSIGLVWPKGEGMHEYPFYQIIFQGIVEACWETDYSLMLLNVKPGHESELLGLFHIDGIILPIPSEEHFEVLQKLNLPLVTTYFKRPNTANIGIDDEHAIEIAFRYLYENGHRKIGFISPAIEHPTAQIRWRAYRKCLADAGIRYNSSYVLADNTFDEQAEQGAYAIEKILKREDKPTSIIFYNDVMALAGLKKAQKLGIAVGEELSVISIDGSPESALSTPPLTTVSVDLKEMGRQAALLIVEFINSGRYEAKHIDVPIQLIIRESVKKIAYKEKYSYKLNTKSSVKINL